MNVLADYEQYGAVVVRQVLNPEEVSLVTAAIEANLNDLSPRAKRASTDDDGSFIEDFCSWQRVPEVEQVVRLPVLSQLAAELMGSQQVRLSTTTCWSKNRVPHSEPHGITTSRITTLKVAKTSACGFRSTLCRGRYLSSFSPDHTTARGTCLGHFLMSRPSGFLREA